MLLEVTIENYKCYKKHTITFDQFSVIIGKNNAGKSTLVEALHLLSIVTQRASGLRFIELKSPLVPAPKGVKPSLRTIDINLKNAFFDYGNPPSIITAKFDNGLHVEVYVLSEFDVVGVFRRLNKAPYANYSRELSEVLPRMSILPQVFPLAVHERILDREYVRHNMDGRLSSLHFRNQLYIYYWELFEDFQRLVNETWPGIVVDGLESQTGENGDELSLFIRDGSFAAEIAWMGHGLQMWMQTIWFLCRAAEAEVVVLDEPDVYLHADLQRKLIHLVRNRWKQIIVATHSVEIITECEPSDIVMLDRYRDSSKLTSDLRHMQKALDRVGSVQNIHLARLSYAGQCLFVEGDDVGILNILFKVLHAEDKLEISTLPNLSLGGWGGWKDAIAASRAIHEFSGGNIAIYCLLDSDYHSDEEKAIRMHEAESHKIELHILDKKELENYLMVPAAIARAINELKPAQNAASADIEGTIDAICDRYKQVVLTGYMDNLASTNHHWSASRSFEEATSIVNSFWTDRSKKWNRVPGKSVLSKLFGECQNRYSVSLSIRRIAYAMTSADIEPEIDTFLCRVFLRK